MLLRLPLCCSSSAPPSPRRCRLPSAFVCLLNCKKLIVPQPVLQEVSHRVLCGLFKEYEDEWQQQQLLPAHRRKERDIRAMNPYFLERAQVDTAAALASFLVSEKRPRRLQL